MKEKFYKLARPDGWDFHTGKTINYREKIGKIIRLKMRGKVELCTNTCIHASRDPNDAFVGAAIPCSVFLVEGKPHVGDKTKCGFRQLRVLEELRPEDVFQWDYKEATNPTNPFEISPPEITEEHITLLREWAPVSTAVESCVRESIWYPFGDSVGGSVWTFLGDSQKVFIRNYIEDPIGDSVEESIGDSIRTVWTVRDSVRTSVWASIRAYFGGIFRNIIPKWKDGYPFQSGVDLWFQGLVPSYDGYTWRLHGGELADVLWEGTP